MNRTRHRGINVDSNAAVYASVLEIYTNIEAVGQVHARMITDGFEKDTFLGSKLVDVYSTRRTVENARQVFDRIPQPNICLFNAMIKAYARNSHG